MKRILAIVACGLLAAVMVRAQSSASPKPYKVVFDLTTDDPQDQAAVLRWLREGTQSEEAYGWGAPGSAHHRVLTGYVARAVGETEIARGQLSLAAAYYRAQLEERSTEHVADDEWEAWVDRLEADAARA